MDLVQQFHAFLNLGVHSNLTVNIKYLRGLEVSELKVEDMPMF